LRENQDRKRRGIRWERERYRESKDGEKENRVRGRAVSSATASLPRCLTPAGERRETLVWEFGVGSGERDESNY